MENRNIYEKLQQARIDFLNSGCKKSGENKFAKFKYFELSDIIPVINPIMQKLKMTAIISFGSELATMELINFEDPKDTYKITSTLADAGTKGQIPIQSLGSQQTYIRRYLYLLAFDIIESDGIEKMSGSPDCTEPSLLDQYKIRFDEIENPDGDLFRSILNEAEPKLNTIDFKTLESYSDKRFKQINR